VGDGGVHGGPADHVEILVDPSADPEASPRVGP
jgi:hypothetical protein